MKTETACPQCEGKCCRDEFGNEVSHLGAKDIIVHRCDWCDDGTVQTKQEAPKAEEVANCPFCGCGAVLSPEEVPVPRVDCTMCNAHLSADYAETRDDLLFRWNMRIPESAALIRAKRIEHVAKTMMRSIVQAERDLRKADRRFVELLRGQVEIELDREDLEMYLMERGG
jgi:hypothetical protein